MTRMMTRVMARAVAISTIGCMLAALMMPFYAEGAQAASRIIVRPPPPRVVVRVPAVHPQQQLSFWGIGTNLQQYRDERQPAPRGSRRLQEKKSANRSQWWGFDQ